MRRRPSGLRSRRGGVLLMALISSVAVAATLTAMLQVNSAITRRQVRSFDNRRAFYLAEAGLAEAFSGVTIGKTGNVGTAGQPAVLGQGLLWVEAAALDADRTRLTSTGMCGRARAVLSLVVERGETSVASLGVFAEQPLVIPPGTRIDGFDSSQPPPESIPVEGAAGPSAATPGRVGSNGKVEATGTLASPTVLKADLSCGPSQSITFNGAVTHVGAKKVSNSTANLPSIEPPFEAGETSVAHSSRTPLLLQMPEIALDKLKVLTGSQITVRGPCKLVVNELSAAGTGKFEFDTSGGPITVWVATTLSLPAGTLVMSSSTDPADLVLQTGSKDPVNLASTGTFTGLIYAPAAQLTVGSQFAVRGSLVAKELVLATGSKLSFDQHIDEVARTLALPTVLSWRIVELGDADPHSPAADPFSLLGLDRSTLPMLAAAHADQRLTLLYVDQFNTTRSYDAMESGFDWGSVKAVLEISRDGKAVAYQPELDSDAAAAVAAAVPSSPALDAINDPAKTSADLRTLLTGLTLTAEEIVALVDRIPALDHSDLKHLLIDSAPLGSSELNKTLDSATQLDSSDVRDVLIASSPLPLDVTARVVAGLPVLSLGDKLAVLAAQ